MICGACGKSSDDPVFKSIDGVQKQVCRECFSWKGSAPPASVTVPVRKNKFKGF